jgi:hypothetical protein
MSVVQIRVTSLEWYLPRSLRATLASTVWPNMAGIFTGEQLPDMPPGYGTFKQAEKVEQQGKQHELGL